MALILMDGFDNYATEADVRKRYGLATCSIANGNSRFGGNSLHFNDTSNEVLIHNEATETNSPIFISFLFNFDSAAPTYLKQNILEFFKLGSSSSISSLKLSENQTIRFVVGTNIVQQSSKVLQPNTWYRIEGRFEIGTAGSVIINVDGQEVINYSGNTSNGAAGYSSIKLKPLGTGYNSYYDDLIIYDETVVAGEPSTYVGDFHIETIRPNLDDSVQWTPLTGVNNFEMIDDVTIDDDATYNSSNVQGSIDLFGFNNLTLSPTQILGVNVVSAARSEETTGLKIRNVLKSGVTQVESQDHFTATTYQFFSDFYGNDPDTNAQWTIAAVNSIKAGYKLQ